MFKAHAVNQHR